MNPCCANAVVSLKRTRKPAFCIAVLLLSEWKGPWGCGNQLYLDRPLSSSRCGLIFRGNRKATYFAPSQECSLICHQLLTSLLLVCSVCGNWKPSLYPRKHKHVISCSSLMLPSLTHRAKIFNQRLKGILFSCSCSASAQKATRLAFECAAQEYKELILRLFPVSLRLQWSWSGSHSSYQGAGHNSHVLSGWLGASNRLTRGSCTALGSATGKDLSTEASGGIVFPWSGFWNLCTWYLKPKTFNLICLTWCAALLK